MENSPGPGLCLICLIHSLSLPSAPTPGPLGLGNFQPTGKRIRSQPDSVSFVDLMWPRGKGWSGDESLPSWAGTGEEADWAQGLRRCHPGSKPGSALQE